MVQANGLILSYESEVEFLDHHLIDPRAKISGCAPDYNVYTNKQNKYPSMEESNIRCAGGHIHVGSDRLANDPIIRDKFVKLCDLFIGAPLMAITAPKHRPDTYGKLGNYRPKSYGVEYRTPSNFWLRDDKLIGWIYDGILQAHKLCHKGMGNSYLSAYGADIIKYINNRQYAQAASFYNKIEIKLPE